MVLLHIKKHCKGPGNFSLFSEWVTPPPWEKDFTDKKLSLPSQQNKFYQTKISMVGAAPHSPRKQRSKGADTPT